MSDAEIVAIYATRQEAEIAQGYLGANGIVANVHSDDAGGMYPQLSLATGGVKLFVSKRDFLAAAALLEELPGY